MELRNVTEDVFGDSFYSAKQRESIANKLIGVDYEMISTIDAQTGEAHPYLGSQIKNVIAEQQAANDYAGGVENYLRKYCVNDDLERVIKETSLQYVREQLKARESFPVAYAIKQNGSVIHKRVLYTYLDETKATILCATQNITELYELESVKRDQIAAALQTLQEIGGMNVARYDLKTKVFYSNSDMATQLGYGEVIENVPEEFIERGLIAPVSIDEYRSFYEKLGFGDVTAITAACRVANGDFHWLRVDARLIYDKDGDPYQAILSFKDIEEQREQAAVYKKWRQSIEHRDSDDYTLFRCNLSKDSSFDRSEGRLLKIKFNSSLMTFNERTREYAGSFVHLDDFDAYTALLNSENLLAGFIRGIHTATLDYRERVGEDEYRWLHLSVELAQYPDSTDVEAFLMYEPSNKEQVEDAALKLRNDSDPLTGILNRRAFVERFTKLLAKTRQGARHTLILVDIDGLKRINDSFGHAVGDQALVDIARSLQGIVQDDGILGRLGGDEFLICLKNTLSQSAIEQKATQILAILRKAFSVEIRLTGSLGIAVYPDDGKDFSTLYHSVDLALYTAKSNGKDSFAFYNGDLMRLENIQSDTDSYSAEDKTHIRHMILVDDNRETLRVVKETFDSEYHIDICTSEKNAISLLSRYGISLSVVLLSLDNPYVDAFALLERMRRIGNMRATPVITISRVEERRMCLHSIRCGANDFVLAPVDPVLLKLRVDSVTGKAENERLRAQNSYYQMQSTAASQFRSVYENTGTVVVECDWGNHSFVYDPAISEFIYGKYDDRSLWHIFMSDMVADVQDVRTMQDLVMDIASSHNRTSGTVDVMLKTPSKARHWFTMNVYKRVNDMNLTSKIILTFLDVNDEIIASKKLRFQAEHDSLTGLYNRATFLKLTEETVRHEQGGSYILLYCDINDFRFINERFGREEGDKLLQYSAERLLAYANSKNGFAGRLSNDAYAILLPNNPGVLERTATVVENFFNDCTLKAKITGRAGAYIISDPDMSADAMLDLASTASNTIKGRFASWLAIYDESMNEKRLREKNISDRMEAALLGGQFDVYFQPQFHHATGQIVGAEALVRWIDPQRGVVSPIEFIPLFEKNGFITRMDSYVWEKTAMYLSVWMEKGNDPVPVSVNVSREDLNDSELCSKLLAIVERYNIPIQVFRLEITESLFAGNTKQLVSVVEQLHNAGFLIEMDDFGSGYSSLNILKDVPVDILKLDMRFFSGEDNLGRGGMIINAVLRMSRWLNIPVIAEGVETKDQADFLLSIGCPTIQGYFYERPMPAAAFEKMLYSGKNNKTVPQNSVETGLETYSFWNPLSADSQVFNNYIGPAAIFEYHDGDYEIVRMNRRFIDTMKINESIMLPVRGLIDLFDEDKPRFKKAVLEAIYSGKDTKVDVRCDLDDEGKSYFRVTLRTIAKSPDRALLFAALDV